MSGQEQLRIFFAPKIRVYYGRKWGEGGPGLTRNFFFKSTQNCSELVLIFWSSIHGEQGDDMFGERGYGDFKKRKYHNVI